MNSYIVVDNREDKVIPHFTKGDYKQEQMTTGDYAIVHENRYVAIIERKTLADYEASIIDGRSENIEKLKEFNKEFGSVVYYLIEGTIPTNPLAKVKKLPYWALESNYIHLTLRHGVSALYSKDAKGTAALLERFLESVKTLTKKDSEFIERFKPILNIEGSEELKRKHITPELTTLKKIWGSLKGITFANCENIIAKYCIFDILESKITLPENSINGKKYPKNIQSEIENITDEKLIKLLENVPTIGKMTAGKIVEQLPASEFAKHKNNLSKISINNKRLGVKGEKIQYFFSLKRDDIKNS